MQGLAAITAQNGWAMAATGACIVITGLAILSFIISQLHRIIRIFEKKEMTEPDIEQTSTHETAVANEAAVDPLADLAGTAKQYQALTATMGVSFPLSQLYQTLDVAKDPHPHITVRELKASGYLVPSEQGLFSWSNI